MLIFPNRQLISKTFNDTKEASLSLLNFKKKKETEQRFRIPSMDHRRFSREQTRLQ